MKSVYLCIFVLSSISSLTLSHAQSNRNQEFEIFDGRYYNGKFYPRIDIIEWGDEPNTHMEFQVYKKDMNVDMSFKLLKKDQDSKVMLVHYFIKDRNEHLCRRVLAPAHFSENFTVYQDKTDKDMNNTLVVMGSLPETKGLKKINPTPYTPCDETVDTSTASNNKPVVNTQNMKEPALTNQPSTAINESRAPATTNTPSITVSKPGGMLDGYIAPPPVAPGKFHAPDGSIKKSGAAVPFSDW